MATLKNTTITDNGYLGISSGTTAQRPEILKYHQAFTTVGSNSWTCPTGVNVVDALVVGGGGGGGFGHGGGGGSGAVLYRANQPVTPGTQYTFTVGSGGSGNASDAQNNPGNASSAFGVTATGGGSGSNESGNDSSGRNGVGGAGANGGGGTYGQAAGGTGTAPVASGWTVYAGFSGGRGGYASANYPTGGGGGAGGTGIAGSDYTSTGSYAGSGAHGILNDILGTPYYWAAGGGGVTFDVNGLPGSGGLGGGGGGSSQGGSVAGAGGVAGYNTGGNGNISGDATGGVAGANTGSGGGGGANENGPGGAGGSGIVALRYSVGSNNTDPRGHIRYNTDLRGVEIYESPSLGWTSLDPTRNFGGHNLLKYSQNFSTWWTLQGITLTASNVLAPDGTNTASLMTVSTGYTPIWRNVDHYTAVPGGIYTMSGYFKAGTSSTVYLTLGNAGLTNVIIAAFNLSTGVITGAEAGGSYTRGSSTYVGATLTNVGNGWYRCAITGIVDSTTTQLRTDYSLQNSSTVNVWGFQLEYASSVGPYVRTVDTFSPVPTVLNGYRIHTYTNTGTSSFSPAVTGNVEVLVVAGGGSGGRGYGGGGGAGGVLYQTSFPVISGNQYTVKVGSGGASLASGGADTRGNKGEDSIFGSLIAVGGGGGGAESDGAYGLPGGSGGGSSYTGIGGGFVQGQGYSGGGGGGGGGFYPASGGGGAGGVGCKPISNTPNVDNYAGAGGRGIQIAISGQPTWYGGGGGGGAGYDSGGGLGGLGGIGGGGNGGNDSNDGAPARTAAGNGTPNTGGGGGGGNGSNDASGAGGSGIVIVRYRYD